MVQTRRQYNNWVQSRGQDFSSQSSEESYHSFYNPSQDNCLECSQRSNASNHSTGVSGPQYRNRDTCKRHRVRDDQPYSEIVTQYRRRKPQRE